MDIQDKVDALAEAYLLMARQLHLAGALDAAELVEDMVFRVGKHRAAALAHADALDAIARQLSAGVLSWQCDTDVSAR